MVMKAIGAGVLLFSLAILAFAGLAYFELHSAATSPTTPSANSMPLTKIVGPELFNTGNTGAKPAALAATIFNRIYAVGGGAMFMAVVAVLILAMPQSRSTKHNAS